MILYHSTSIKNLQNIFKFGLLPIRCYEWVGLYDGIVPKDEPIIWFADNFRPLGEYYHPTRCLLSVESSSLSSDKLKQTQHKSWWIYADTILPSEIHLVDWSLYRRQKPRFWDAIHGVIGGGFKCTLGKSQAAINLMSMLQKPEYQGIRHKVLRILTKQICGMKAIMAIKDKVVREATLKMWHDRFVLLVINLPEVVKTHARSIETGIYRQLLKDSKSQPNAVDKR